MQITFPWREALHIEAKRCSSSFLFLYCWVRREVVSVIWLINSNTEHPAWEIPWQREQIKNTWNHSQYLITVYQFMYVPTVCVVFVNVAHSWSVYKDSFSSFCFAAILETFGIFLYFTHSHNIYVFRNRIYHLTAKLWQESAMSARDPETQHRIQPNTIETGLVMNTTQRQLWQHPEVWQANQVALGSPLNMTHVL